MIISLERKATYSNRCFPTLTAIKHAPPKHSAAYNIGYKLGTADSKIGGAGLWF